jgi:hypothetical protein
MSEEWNEERRHEKGEGSYSPCYKNEDKTEILEEPP